ncbi:unnamed protein product [Ixodes pacificus]
MRSGVPGRSPSRRLLARKVSRRLLPPLMPGCVFCLILFRFLPFVPPTKRQTLSKTSSSNKKGDPDAMRAPPLLLFIDCVSAFPRFDSAFLLSFCFCMAAGGGSAVQRLVLRAFGGAVMQRMCCTSRRYGASCVAVCAEQVCSTVRLD